MNTVKQPNDWSCLAACCAMITGEPIEAVFEVLGHDGSDRIPESEHPEKRRAFTIPEAAIFLGTRSKILGALLHISEEEILSCTTDGTPLKIETALLQAPAIVCVQSERFPGLPHMVVWDPEVGMARDPNPDASQLRGMGCFKPSTWGFEWWAVTNVTPAEDRLRGLVLRHGVIEQTIAGMRHLLHEVWSAAKCASASGERWPCECEACKALERRINEYRLPGGPMSKSGRHKV